MVYSTSDPSVAAVSGNIVTLTGIGTVVLTATQAGNSEWSATTNTHTLRVGTGTESLQTITFPQPSDRTVGDPSFVLTATASSGLPVTYSSSNPAVATIEGSAVTIRGAGSCTLTASQAGNASYQPAAPVQRVITVGKSAQVIPWSALPSIPYGTMLTLPQVAASGLVIVYRSSDPGIIEVAGNVLKSVGVGSVSVFATIAEDANFLTAASVQNLTATKAAQYIDFGDVPNRAAYDPPLGLPRLASSGLPIVYSSSNPAVATLNGPTLTIVGEGAATISASQPGDQRYLPALTITRTLTVRGSAQASQTITFGELTPSTFGAPPFNITATTSSGLPVSFSSASPTVASITGNTVTILKAGSTTLTATQIGNEDFLPAPMVSQVLTVNRAPQTIAFGTLAGRTFGDPPFAVSATATSGLPVSFTSSNSAIATISGNVTVGFLVNITGGGNVTITARQTGDANYLAAPNVGRTLTVSKTPQSITFPSLPPRVVGDPPFDPGATASSGLPVTYTSSNPAVATVSGTTLSIVGPGSTIITARQAGDSRYLAATEVSQVLTLASGFNPWRFSRFTAAELADLSRSGPNAVYGFDGLTNQVKYALGLEPKVNVITGQPEIGENGTEWHFDYTRPATSPPEVSGYTVEVSFDLSNPLGWSTSGVTHELVSNIGTTATWRGRYPMRTAANPDSARRVFFRLKTTVGNNASYSPPLGGLSFELAAGQATVIALPFFDFPAGPGAVIGRLTDAGSNYVEAAGAAWTPGTFSGPALPYFLRVRSGVSAGRILPVTSSANSDSRLYVDTDGLSLTQSGVTVGADGDAYELIPAETLTSVFTGLGLTGGASAAAADLVQVWSGASWLVFYFNTDRNQWERNVDTGASPSRDSFVLRPDRGILVQRRNAGPATIYLQHRGRVPEFAARFFHARPGTTFLGIGGAADIRLAELSGSLGVGTLGGWTASSSPANATATADLLLVWSPPANRWLIHYFDFTTTRWQEAGDLTNTNRSDVVIPAGQAVILRRLGTSDQKLITLPFPYTIDR